MALLSGTRLGPYEVIAALAAGGMGEVYRARDLRLGRDVAIKLLPAAFDGAADRVIRFEREARAAATVNHPNILAVHDVGEHDGSPYIVSELLQGQTLRERLDAGPLPPRKAVEYAMQIALGLAAAHKEGITHRDLKPENIFITADARVKILDFGLAKLTQGESDSQDAGITSVATIPGLVLGTVGYMAPEQVRGLPTDHRSDIFALGAILYEMLSGRCAFQGDTTADRLAAILDDDPPGVAVVTASPLIESIVGKCLSKDPEDRWESAADLATALRWAADGVKPTALSPSVGIRPASRIGRTALAALSLFGALALTALGIGIGQRVTSSSLEPPSPIRFEVHAPVDAILASAPATSASQLALSPDGRSLAFVAARNRGMSQVWIRHLDSVDAKPLAGTEGASFPFWSPDSRFVAFFAAGKLKKIDINGGAPQTLCDAPLGRGGSWSQAGVIAFSPQPSTGLSRIAAVMGGVATPATTMVSAQESAGHLWPQFLPDGRLLYYQRSLNPEYNGVYVTALDSSDQMRVLAGESMAVYTAGHLVFAREGMLFAQRFDLRTLRTIGEPVRLADGVAFSSASFGYAAFTASATGAIAYGPDVPVTTTLQWRTRTGAVLGAPIASAFYEAPRLSIDQRHVAVGVRKADDVFRDVWILDLTRGAAMSRLTTDPGNDRFPVWSADGLRLLFGSNRSGPTTIFETAAGGGPDRLFDKDRVDPRFGSYPVDISSNGQFLAFQQVNAGYDLNALPLVGDKKPTQLAATRFNEVQGRFSPDGKWFAYASDESGQFEVYVRPFPAAGGRIPISTAGGMQPEWRRDGRELFYISADRKLTAVAITVNGSILTASVPRPLFDVDVPEPIAPFATDYAVTADGQRFLVNTVVDQPTQPALTLILNWTSELQK